MPDDTSSSAAPGAGPVSRGAEPDAHGQAGLFLAESILHALIETKTLTVDQAIGVVCTASEVKVEMAHESGETEGRIKQSVHLLGKIERSLRIDQTRARGE